MAMTMPQDNTRNRARAQANPFDPEVERALLFEEVERLRLQIVAMQQRDATDKPSPFKAHPTVAVSVESDSIQATLDQVVIMLHHAIIQTSVLWTMLSDWEGEPIQDQAGGPPTPGGEKFVPPIRHLANVLHSQGQEITQRLQGLEDRIRHMADRTGKLG